MLEADNCKLAMQLRSASNFDGMLARAQSSNKSQDQTHLNLIPSLRSTPPHYLVSELDNELVI